MTAPAEPVRTARVRYGTRRPLAPLLLKYLLLTVVTLGIYRFWAKTALRRYFWRAVKVDRTPFEYVGRGGELLIGFLIALAALAPLAAVHAGLQWWFKGSPPALGLLQAATLVVLYALGHVARFQARRYRLSRTRWRNIRAGQDGSSWGYLGRALLWGLVGLVTLGLAVPWGSMALQRYRTNATRFGDRRFAFTGGAGPLVPLWLLTWGTGLLGLVALGVAALQAGQAPPYRVATAAAAFGALALVVAAIAYAAYRTAMLRHFSRCTSLGGVRFESRARAGAMLQVAAIYVGALAVLLLGLGMLAAFGAMLFGEPIRGPLAGSLPQLAVAGAIVGVPGIWLGHYFLWTLVVQTSVLEHLCETFTVQGLEELATVAPSTAPGPRFGEGLASALDAGAA